MKFYATLAFGCLVLYAILASGFDVAQAASKADVQRQEQSVNEIID